MAVVEGGTVCSCLHPQQVLADQKSSSAKQHASLFSVYCAKKVEVMISTFWC